MTPDTDARMRYEPTADAFDEMVTADGTTREHWRDVAGALESLGTAGLEVRAAQADRLLRNDGVTITVGDDPTGFRRPWTLDPVPLVVSSDEWHDVERGVTQRAELLDLVLADIYGPQDLVRRGLLPLELVEMHPGYLRPLAGAPQRGRRLTLVGVDLIRRTDGTFCAVSDRAQAPSGIGYALVNRLVMSRVFPSLYRDAQVHRLAHFLRTLRAQCTAAADVDPSDARVVILTPGPLSETYFEHAYLSTYLGWPLVEATDLTVRRGSVWLRSPSGLEPVHVIVRRVDDAYCDPLELRPDSVLGVPGLVEAVRRGNVAVVNALGSGIVESPALMQYLPALCEAVLGQELRLPSVRTWWCGEPAGRAHVLANLDALVVKPIGRHDMRRSVVGPNCDGRQLHDLRRRIEESPAAFVGQELMPASTVPALRSGALRAAPATLRAFLVAREDGWVTMPGGLARVADAELRDDPVSRSAATSTTTSKDTWVLATEAQPSALPWAPTAPAFVEAGDVLPSRVAENLWWLGRYAERAEQTIRLLRAVAARLDEPPGDDALGESLQALLDAVAITTDAPITAITPHDPPYGADATHRTSVPGAAAIEAALLAAVLNPERPGSLVRSLRGLIDAAVSVREQLADDTWQIVGDVDELLGELQAQPPDTIAAASGALAELIRSLLALSGVAAESLVRDVAWRFLDGGRRLERGIQLCRLLQATVVPTRSAQTDPLVLESVLRVLDSSIVYRRRNSGRIDPVAVLDLVLVDAANPRGLAHQLDTLGAHLAALPHDRTTERLHPEERAVLEASTVLRVADPADLATATTGSRQRRALETLCWDVGARLYECHDALTRRLFVAPRATQLVEGTP